METDKPSTMCLRLADAPKNWCILKVEDHGATLTVDLDRKDMIQQHWEDPEDPFCSKSLITVPARGATVKINATYTLIDAAGHTIAVNDNIDETWEAIRLALGIEAVTLDTENYQKVLISSFDSHAKLELTPRFGMDCDIFCHFCGKKVEEDTPIKQVNLLRLREHLNDHPNQQHFDAAQVSEFLIRENA